MSVPDSDARVAIPFERHVFVCTNARSAGDVRGCCSARGGEELREQLKRGVKERGLAGRVRVNGAGCLDFCAFGATIVVYPENVWYGAVRAEDVAEIIERHLDAGVPVARLRIPDAALAERIKKAK